MGSTGLLNLKSQKVSCKNLFLTGLSDPSIFYPPLSKRIFHTENLVLDGCDKNFIYYWLTPRIFPHVKDVFLFSHPCENSVIHRFKGTLPRFHTNSRNMRYINNYEGDIISTEENMMIYVSRYINDLGKIKVIT